MRLEPMTQSEAADYAPQWGSYMTAGDPGACFYGPVNDPATARAMLDGIPERLAIASTRTTCDYCDDAPLEDCDCPDDVRELERLALYLEPIAGRRWHVTYESVTEESAREGDCAESGFINGAGDRVPARIGQPTPLVGMTLREALELWNGLRDNIDPLEPDASAGPVRSLRDVGGLGTLAQCADGESVSYTLHAPAPMTRASAARLAAIAGSPLL